MLFKTQKQRLEISAPSPYLGPALVDENLLAWKELNQYSPKDQTNHHELTNTFNPKRQPKWMHLVHMIRDPESPGNQKYLNTPFVHHSLSWDTFSTSLISNETSWCVIGYFGFILDVPYQNIILTSHRDFGINHYVGINQQANNKYEEIVNKGKLWKEILQKRNYCPKIESPSAILKNTNNMEYAMQNNNVYFAPHNEIVVARKPHLYMHQGAPATEPIGVKGIYVLTGHPSFEKYYDMAQKVAKINGVPIIYIKSSRHAGAYTNTDDRHLGRAYDEYLKTHHPRMRKH